MRRRANSVLTLVGCLALLFEYGCSKTGGDPGAIPSPVSNAIVADLVAASLGGSSSTQGVSAQVEEATIIAGGGTFPKLAAETDLRTFDTTIVREGSTGTTNYHYEFHFSIAFVNFGNRLNFNYTMHGFYNTPKISSVDSASSAIVVTHILDADTVYTVNSTYRRDGAQHLGTLDVLEFASTITGTMTDVKVGKSTHEIQSGTGLYVVTGRASTGGTFSYSVTVTFLGHQQALMTINGVPYMVDLDAGTATRVTG